MKYDYAQNFPLTIELIPEPCWNKNLRTKLPKNKWNNIRYFVKNRAQGRCETCGSECSQLEAHEKWEYDDVHHIQKLVGVVAICRDCHAVKHLGRTQAMGHEMQARNHFMAVNHADAFEYANAVMFAKAQFAERSKHQWQQDLTWLESQDFEDAPISSLANNQKSILGFPSNYVLLDVETTGLDSFYDRIIEIAAIRVRNNQVVDTLSTLVNPCDAEIKEYWIEKGDEIVCRLADGSEKVFCPVSSFIENLTGISNRMVVDAPKAIDIIPKVRDFIGDETVLGCNTSFDMKFLNEAFMRYLKKPFNNSYIDIQILARRLIFNVGDYKLDTLAQHFAIEYTKHRAESDGLCTKAVYDNLIKVAIVKYGSIETFAQMLNKNQHRTKIKSFVPSKPIDAKDEFWHGKVFYLAGRFEWIDKAKIMQLLVDKGVKLSEKHHYTVDYIVISHLSKQKSLAEAVSALYYLTSVISERELYELLFLENRFVSHNEVQQNGQVASMFDISGFTSDKSIEVYVRKHAHCFNQLLSDEIEYELKAFMLSKLDESVQHKCQICGETYERPRILVQWEADKRKITKTMIGLQVVCNQCDIINHIVSWSRAMKGHPRTNKQVVLDSLRHYMHINNASFAETIYAYRKFLFSYMQQAETKPQDNPHAKWAYHIDNRVPFKKEIEQLIKNHLPFLK